jgi:hypothetical protein
LVKNAYEEKNKKMILFMKYIKDSLKEKSLVSKKIKRLM